MNQKTGAVSYTALDSTKPEIRLINLYPRGVTNGIKCELILADLNEKPIYEALSYEWGPSAPVDFCIKLNNQEHFVRKNLWLALLCLRSKDGPRTLWIDAICVDQSNIPERNHQVGQMGRIYSQASGVVVWLGMETQDTVRPENNVNLAQDFLRELGANKNLRLSRRQIAKYEKDLRCDDLLGLKINALLELCHRTYWTRLWVIQEVILSHRGIIQCGSFTFDLDIFRKLFSSGLIWTEFCRWADDTAAAKMRTSPAMRLFDLNRKHDNRPMSMTIIQLMSRTSYTECGDARDKIFGLLNICAECCRIAIPPDYSRSLEEICQSVLEHHFSQHSNGEFYQGRTEYDLSEALYRAIGKHL